uniref:FA complementation group E n=1 Tax=Junco hyemalis TaxID=40217 RepID=A0A8C5JP94_JUNHY
MSLIVSIRIRAGINGVGVPSGRRCDPCVAVPFVCRPCPAVPRCVTAPGVPVSRRRCAAPAAAMEPRCPPWLQRCPRPCRLLLLSLCSGPAGAVAALRALQRGRPRHGAGLPFPWPALTAALCAEEPSLEGPEDALAVKPRLLLLPVLCQRNLFSLLLVVQDAVPRDCLHQLLQALEKDSHVDPWVQALGDLLQQGPSAQESSPHPTALSAGCQQQLKGLCQKIAQQKPERQGKLSWCFSKQAGAPDSVPQGGERKEVSEESLEVDSEREGKRLLEEVAFEPQECGDVAEVEEEMPEEPSGDASAQAPAPLLQLLRGPAAVPNAPHAPVPPQLEGLCSFLQLSTCPEPSLVRFCSWLLPLSPALSHTSAAILAQQLFLRRVLALTQPPSRHLMAALMSFCSKYSHALCRVLVAAVLQGPGEGVQGCWELWLFGACLDGSSHLEAPARPQSSTFPLHCPCSQVLEVPLSEKLLPVLQAVLGRQVLPPELLDLLVLTLCQQAPAFASSLNFARLVTAVLTVYQSQVSPARAVPAAPGAQPRAPRWAPGRAGP